MKQQNGFTLMELMVVVIIVGIIASFAIPGYADYVRRGKLTGATATLSDARVKMELHAQDNPITGYANPAAICPAATPTFTYDCNTPAATKDTYKLTATGIGSMTGFSYTVDQANNRTSTTPFGSGACWITKRGMSC